MKVTEIVKKALVDEPVLFEEKNYVDDQFIDWCKGKKYSYCIATFLIFLREQVEKEKISDEKKGLDKQK